MNDAKHFRFSRWSRRKAKHHKDYKHGKQGMVGGNARYSDPAQNGNKPPAPEFLRHGRPLWQHRV